MKIKLHPPLRRAFEMAALEQQYASRLTELFGSVADAKQSHDEWRVMHQPVVHHWTTYNAIAMQEVCSPLLPSERRLMVAEVTF